MADGRRARAARRGRAMAALSILGIAAAAGASRDVVLYRIPGERGMWFHYTDRKPPASVRFEEVGGYARTERPVWMPSGNRRIVVYYPKGDDRLAQQIAEDVWNAARLCEQAAGFPFAWSGDIKVFKVPEFEIGAAAQNRGAEGIMASESNPYLLYHEIAHFWVNTDLYERRWTAEGFAELLAYIVGLRIQGKASAETFRAWKLHGIRAYGGRDFPLDTWEFGRQSPLEEERFAYGKAFVACALLMERVGLYRLQEINRTIRARRRPVNTREFVGLIDKAIGPGKVDDDLSGWVLQGPYRLRGQEVSLRDYLAHLEKNPPAVPIPLDPRQAATSSPATTSGPASRGSSSSAPASRGSSSSTPTSRPPVGFFVDQDGNPLLPPTSQPASRPAGMPGARP